MQVLETKLNGIKIIIPDVFGDNRGWFTESYSLRKYTEFGISTVFIQDNHSMSSEKGTLRGLHFQKDPFAQNKLVRCTRGELLDVAVDIRKGSSTYCQWFSIVLSELNHKQLFIPAGFAHGFLTLSENTEIQYKVDAYYSPVHDRSIRYDDPVFNINWGIDSPILSDKDKNAPLLAASDSSFILKGIS